MITGALQSAGTGVLAGTAVFGRQGTVGQIGGALGGILGDVAGKQIGKALGNSLGALGSAMGPIGSMVGGILGTALGGLLTSTQRGGATIGGVNGQLGVVGTSGNSDARIAAANKSAGGIIEGLTQLADQLGATIDPSRGRVTIGMYKDNWRVSTSGSSKLGGYKGSESENASRYGLYNFGEDAEAAAYFAMMDLIKDGVLVGLRAGTERLLKNAKDIEAGISKALAFEGVFKDLAALKDPLGSAMDALDREFERLRKIFAEAGATTAEYAQLEELYQLRRQDALDRANQEALDKVRTRREMEIEVLELLGRRQDAVTASRELELAGLEASLRPLQQMIYQLRDARTIIEQFEPLAADLRAFKDELLGGRSAGSSLSATRARFGLTAAEARMGNAEALGRLRGDANAYLEAAKANASSALEYQQALGQVLNAVDQGLFAAEEQIDYAQLQIDAINNSANIMAEMKDKLVNLTQKLADNSDEMLRLTRRIEGDGLTVKTDDDTPLKTEAV